jgi:spore germination protein
VRGAGGHGLGVRVTLAAAALAALALAPGVREPRRLAPGPPPKVFAFVSRLGGAELRRLEAVGPRIDVIAPNWYALDPASGALAEPVRGAADPVLRAARHDGVAVWPTVNARTGGSPAWQAPAVRAGIAAALRAVALGSGARGATLDMEELRPSQRAAFSTLVREAAIALHAVHRRLAVYVMRTGAAYDWRALAASADLVLVSGYNEHWSGSRPGPTMTSGGFASTTRRALALAGPRRAVPVLGAFGYRWAPGVPGRLISSTDAGALRVRTGGPPVVRDGSARFRLGADTVVYETVAGLRARAREARAAGARWIGLFSLGREPARFWRGLVTARSAHQRQ